MIVSDDPRQRCGECVRLGRECNVSSADQQLRPDRRRTLELETDESRNSISRSSLPVSPGLGVIAEQSIYRSDLNELPGHSSAPLTGAVYNVTTPQRILSMNPSISLNEASLQSRVEAYGLPPQTDSWQDPPSVIVDSQAEVLTRKRSLAAEVGNKEGGLSEDRGLTLKIRRSNSPSTARFAGRSLSPPYVGSIELPQEKLQPQHPTSPTENLNKVKKSYIKSGSNIVADPFTNSRPSTEYLLQYSPPNPRPPRIRSLGTLLALESRSFEINSPAPSTTQNAPPILSSDSEIPFLTPRLAYLAMASELFSKRWHPKTQTRKLRATERGYWRFRPAKITAWSENEKMYFWTFLRDFIEAGSAGWGVRCELEVLEPSVHESESLAVLQDAQRRSIVVSTPQMASYGSDGTIYEEDEEVRLYCWGAVVPHLWLLLWQASKRKIMNKSCVEWVDADQSIVVVMD
jgi:hypothetical protein